MVVGVLWGGASALHSKRRMADRARRDRPFRSFKMSAKAQRRRRAGKGYGSAALIPPRAGNGGDGEPPLTRGGFGSVCIFTSVYIHHHE